MSRLEEFAYLLSDAQDCLKKACSIIDKALDNTEHLICEKELASIRSSIALADILIEQLDFME